MLRGLLIRFIRALRYIKNKVTTQSPDEKRRKGIFKNGREGLAGIEVVRAYFYRAKSFKTKKVSDGRVFAGVIPIPNP